MLWFGGFSGQVTAPRIPVGVRHLWPAVPGRWLYGEWTPREVRTAYTARRALAVIGACGMVDGELDRLALHGVPDDVAWRWPGSYVVVQVTDDGTTIWTDVGGASPIYLLSADGGVYWSSSSRALAALTGHRLDLERLAVWLLAPAAPAMLDGRSAFAGVSLVPAGHRLFLPSTGRPETRRVWRPWPRPGDHAARLRAELSAAVAVRVDSVYTPTVDLSGGYDSTALALLAAERLSPDRAVTAVTVHPAGITTTGDVMYARHVAEHPGIVHRLMALGPEHVPYGALEVVPVTDEPAPSTIAHKRFSAQLQWMRDRLGSDCHITGDGGDSLLSPRPIMLADLVAHGHIRRTLAETIAWARLRRVAVWPLAVAAVRTARTTRTAALQALAHSLRADGSGHDRAPSNSGIAWFPSIPAPPWSTHDTRELAASLVAGAVDRSDAASPSEITTYVTAEVMADVGRSARADVQLAQSHGISLHNPFVDSRVIDAYLAVPLHARPGPAEYKPILRRAMSDLFPAALARRRTKGSFTSDYYGGMRVNLAALHDLADGHLAECGLVDPARLRQTLTLAAAGIPAAFATVEPVITAEVWLRALHRTLPVPWTTLATVQGAM